MTSQLFKLTGRQSKLHTSASVALSELKGLFGSEIVESSAKFGGGAHFVEVVKDARASVGIAITQEGDVPAVVDVAVELHVDAVLHLSGPSGETVERVRGLRRNTVRFAKIDLTRPVTPQVSAKFAPDHNIVFRVRIGSHQSRRNVSMTALAVDDPKGLYLRSAALEVGHHGNSLSNKRRRLHPQSKLLISGGMA